MPLPEDYKGAELSRGGGGASEAVPEDVYQVEVVDINLRKDVPNYKKPEVLQDWLDFDLAIIEKGDQYGKILKYGVTNKWKARVGAGQPSNLWLLAEGITGKEPEELEEGVNFDPNSLMSGQVRVTIKNKVSEANQQTYSNVQKSFLVIKEKLPKFDEKKVEKVEEEEEEAEVDLDEATEEISGKKVK